MMAPYFTDDDLMRRATLGERPALIELLERHGLSVRRQLEGKIDKRWQSMLNADDVMQETYADALLGIRGFTPEGEGSFSRWLSRMAHNNLLDAIRVFESLRQGGEWCRIQPTDRDGSALDLLLAINVTTTTASKEVMRQEAAVLVQQALAQLPYSYREVISRYDLDGQSAQQVADALSCSVGTVYMRRTRGLEMLRKLLGSGSCI